MERYNIRDVERKWQSLWSESKVNNSVVDKNCKSHEIKNRINHIIANKLGVKIGFNL